MNEAKEQQQCKRCRHKHECEQIYKKLGNSRGPSVVGQVLIAFALPMLFFIVALALFEQFLSGALASESVLTVVSFCAAITLTLVSITVIKALSKRVGKYKNQEE